MLNKLMLPRVLTGMLTVRPEIYIVSSKLEVGHCEASLYWIIYQEQKTVLEVYKIYRQDPTGIPMLFSDGNEFNTARDKASVFNNHF